MSFTTILFAFLTSILVVAPQQLTTQRAEARDATRVSTVMQVRTALELYYSDHGQYPLSRGILLGESEATTLSGKGFGLGGAVVKSDDASVPIYMMRIPADPGEKTPYRYWSNGKDYVLEFILEHNTGAYTAGANVVSTLVMNPYGERSLDDDHDALPNFVEQLFGTDATKTDTDGDGYGDAQELQNGYNPNGLGKMKF